MYNAIQAKNEYSESRNINLPNINMEDMLP